MGAFASSLVLKRELVRELVDYVSTAIIAPHPRCRLITLLRLRAVGRLYACYANDIIQNVTRLRQLALIGNRRSVLEHAEKVVNSGLIFNLSCPQRECRLHLHGRRRGQANSVTQLSACSACATGSRTCSSRAESRPSIPLSAIPGFICYPWCQGCKVPVKTLLEFNFPREPWMSDSPKRVVRFLIEQPMRCTRCRLKLRALWWEMFLYGRWMQRCTRIYLKRVYVRAE